MYGSELSVGEGLRQAMAAGEISRAELWVTSKVLSENKAPEASLRAACAGSLQRLGLEYLDLYLLHDPFGPGECRDVISRHSSAALIGNATGACTDARNVGEGLRQNDKTMPLSR